MDMNQQDSKNADNYSKFRVVEIGARMMGLYFIRYNKTTKELCANRSFAAVLNYAFSLVWLFCLIADAFYAIIIRASGAMLLYIPEMLLIVIYHIWTVFEYPKLQRKQIEAINSLNVIDKILMRYYRRNHKKATRSTDIAISVWNACLIVTTIVFGVHLVLHFWFPFAKMFSIQYLAYCRVYPTSVFLYVLKSLLINRLSMTVGFIRSNVGKAQKATICYVCEKGEFPSNTLCEKHTLRQI